MASSWMKYVFERFSYFLFQPLLPLRAKWLVNVMKFQSRLEWFISKSYAINFVDRPLARWNGIWTTWFARMSFLSTTTLECSLVHQEYVFQFTTRKIRPKFASQMEVKHDDVPRYLKDAIANIFRSETSKVRFFVSLDLLPHIAFIHQKYTFLGD